MTPELKSLTSKMYLDIIYFDAFAPAAQPELWTKEIFDKLYNMFCRMVYLSLIAAKEMYAGP